jgi:hypothetical protein
MAKKKTINPIDNVDGSVPAAPTPVKRRPTTRSGSAQAAAARADDAAATPLSSGNGAPISVNVPPGVGSNRLAAAYGPSYDEIAAAAYQRYLSRGGNHGQDFDDWIQAERELRARQG